MQDTMEIKMKMSRFGSSAIIVLSAVWIAACGQTVLRETIEMDTGWLYTAGDNAGYASKTAAESGFERVCIPHANVITKHAYQSEKAFQFVSWYRRHSAIPARLSGRRVFLEFEAVSIGAEVYVNGEKAGEHQGAYTPFIINITGLVVFGEDNVIAVKVDSRAHSSVPPEGSTIDFMIYGGIVRHVRMTITDPLHIDRVFASTDNPSQTKPAAPAMNIKARVVNQGAAVRNCRVVASITDQNSVVVASANESGEVPADGSHEFSLTIGTIASAQLRGVDHPYLYTVITRVMEGETVLDGYRTRTGIRSLTMNKTDGKCYLNGTALKLRGLNRHEAYPYIGHAASRRLQRKDADILKYDLGCNIVRTSHYPQAPDFLDRCDEIGLLVLEEVPGWMYIGNTAWKNL